MSAVAASQVDLDALKARVDEISAQPAAFVNGGAEQTVAQLLANYPASASMLYKYARVSDLFNSTRSVMICEGSGSDFYWRPQRTDFAAAQPTTTGSVALMPLVTAPIVFFTGTLVGSVSVTPSSVNAWPGATFTVVANGVMNLLGINIGGLVGGGTVPLLSGSQRVITYVQGAGWRAG